MAKEENKKEKSSETIENIDENQGIALSILLFMSNLLNSPNSVDKAQKTNDYEYLKELYHSLDKRLAILESKSKRKLF